MRKSLGNTLCAGLVALGMTTSAHAVEPQFEASMNWSGFAVTLSDLDLSDGVTPTLQWTSQTTGASILMNGTLSSAAPAADFTSNVSIDDGFRFAGGDGTTLATTGSGLDGTLSFLEINVARYGKFTLSPMTKVDFTLPVAASAMGMPPGISFLGSLFLSANFTSFDSADLAEGETISGRTLAVSFSNQNSVEAPNVSFSSGIVVNAYAAPVPEPGEWAMMLAGLGLVGAAALRRRA